MIRFDDYLNHVHHDHHHQCSSVTFHTFEMGFVDKRLSLKPPQVQINTMTGSQTGCNSEEITICCAGFHYCSCERAMTSTVCNTCVYGIKTASQRIWNIQTSAEHMCMAKNSPSSTMLALEPQDTKPALLPKPFFPPPANDKRGLNRNKEFTITQRGPLKTTNIHLFSRECAAEDAGDPRQHLVTSGRLKYPHILSRVKNHPAEHNPLELVGGGHNSH